MNILLDADTTLPRWGVMWLLAGALFMAGKMVMFLRIRRRGVHRWPGWKVAAWFFLWPGMNPADIDRTSREHPLNLVFPALKVTAGAMILWGLARRFADPLAAGWCGMIGLILVLHFGLFGMVAGFWQHRGLRAVPIMNRPIAARSIAEFWGRRWNLAFRDLTHPLLFAPLAKRWGIAAATWISFGVSGLAHELVISVPAGAGYGLPTAYFLLQALGIFLERHLGIRRSNVSRWLLTHAFTALPAFFLFHPPFVERVMVPFFYAIRALP
jgi:alginate O-acetyltransferase complex protein AlgI